MSDDLREQFGRDGFVIVRDVVPAADMGAVA